MQFVYVFGSGKVLKVSFLELLLKKLSEESDISCIFLDDLAHVQGVNYFLYSFYPIFLLGS